MNKICLILILFGGILPLKTIKASDNFAWKNASVYFVITDRFLNGDTLNDVNYGRIVDYGSERLNASTFHGGDFAGLLKKTQEGYFQKLGVNVVWMTDIYEQIHGWMSGSGAINDFPHYGYHGYYPFDYTQIDKNYGTVEEFRALVNELHAQGIRVMLGANLNNPGYPTLLDAVQYGFAPVKLTQKQAAEHIKAWNYNTFYAQRGTWKKWYNRDWIRQSDENWDENNPFETTLYGMPEFKDESIKPTKIPIFLKEKWKKEGKSNDAWVVPAARKWRNDTVFSPSQYLIAWISAYVEEFGIDGFRCDIVEYIHPEGWKALNAACNEALNKWRQNHPQETASQWNDTFYMTGDFDHASIDYKPLYSNCGFSSMVNFYFPKKGDLNAIAYVWQAYSDSIEAHQNWHPFSYLNNAYFRDTEEENKINCATTLLLSPGAIQIFYGDETAREQNKAAQMNIDSNQAFRSDMNWNSIDSAVLSHYQKLGTIRRNYPALTQGKQITLSVHQVVRFNEGDTLIIRLLPQENTYIEVSPYFKEGEEVMELYTNQTAIVENGRIAFSYYENSVAILSVKKKK